jgi:hypothetical protein
LGKFDHEHEYEHEQEQEQEQDHTAVLKNRRLVVQPLEKCERYPAAHIIQRKSINVGDSTGMVPEVRSTPKETAAFGDFLFANRDEITRRWVTVVDRSPEVAASEDLTYRQLLDHLPQLCSEMAALLKDPRDEELRDSAKQDAGAHGRKRWRQGYNLEELIREICLIRQNFFETWPDAFAEKAQSFHGAVRERANQIVARFFDNLIIDSTVEFVEEQSAALHKIHAELIKERNAAAHAKSEVLRHISHNLREPLTAIVFAAELLNKDKTLSTAVRDSVDIIVRNARAEAAQVDELIYAASLLPRVQQTLEESR